MPRLVIALFAASLCWGCSDDSTCAPGATQLCVCSNAAQGAQVCDSSGSRWGTCVCNSPPDAEPDAATDTGTDLDLRDQSVDKPRDTTSSDVVDGPSTKTIAQLVRGVTLDSDEQYLHTLLSSTSYTVKSMVASDLASSQVGGVDLFYMRTGAEPSSYGSVVNTLLSAVQSGATLVVEHRGAHLLEYMGLGTVKTWSWSPVVKSSYYFVKGHVAHDIFNALSVWDPPTSPNNPAQLIRQTIKLGTVTATYLEPDSGSTYQLLHFWRLDDSPGWTSQSTSSTYCVSHPGLCTSSRSVHETSLPPSQRHIGSPIIVFTVGLGKAIFFHHGVTVDSVKPEAMGEAIRKAIIEFGLK